MKFSRLFIASLAMAGLMYGCGDDSDEESGAPTPETTAELCSDGIDNDGDGLKDCDVDTCKQFDNCKGAEGDKECPAAMPTGKKDCTCDKTKGEWTNCQDDVAGDKECPADMPAGKKDCTCDKTKGEWTNCQDDVAEKECTGDMPAGKKDCNCDKSTGEWIECQDDTQPKTEICGNDADDDEDGKVDCDDEDCAEDAACKQDAKEICDNKADDDEDGKIDCDDEDCAEDAACKQDAKEICDNKADDDEDGKIDCDDEDCAEDANCKGSETKEICDNDADDDGDGKVDCDDEDCAEAANCKASGPAENTEELCKDGEDNDNNGKKDCEEDSCKDFLNCIYEAQDAHIAECLNEKDDDGDGKIDCADDDCKDMFPNGCPTIIKPKDGLRAYCDSDNHVTVVNDEDQIVGSQTCTYECKEPPCCEAGKCKTCEEDYGTKKFCNDGNLSYCKDGQLVTDNCEFGCFENTTVAAHCNKCQPLLSVCSTKAESLNQKQYAVACEPRYKGSDTHPILTGYAPKETYCKDGCEDGYCKEFCVTQMGAPGECVSQDVLKICVSNEYKYKTCEFGCNTKTGLCRVCYEGAIQCSSDGTKVQKCENNKWVDQETCTNSCQSGFCLNDDKTINGMKADVAPDFSKAKDCIKNSECASGEFCDSFLGKCSIRCTDDNQCIDGYKCRPDGRCASDTFHIAMETCNKIVEIPTKNATKCNFTIYWGDSENSRDVVKSCGTTNLTHEYPADGIYSIRIVGQYEGFSMNDIFTDKTNNTHKCYFDDWDTSFISPNKDGSPLKAIYTFGPVGLGKQPFNAAMHDSMPFGIYLAGNDIPDATLMTSMEAYFAGYESSTNLNVIISKWDVSHVTNMRNLFFTGRFQITGLDLSRWDVSNVENMQGMLRNVGGKVGIENWDVSKVKDMSYIFWLANVTDDISKWDVSNVTNMADMFEYSYMNPDITKWNVGNVTDMSRMFSWAQHFNQPIGNWDVSKVKNMSHMFDNASAFNQDIGNWDVSNVTDMSYMFAGDAWYPEDSVTFNQDLSKWSLDSLEDASHMFEDNKVFDKDLSGWVMPKVKNMYAMFWRASAYAKAFVSLPKPEANLTCSDLKDIYTGTAVSCEDIKKLIELWNIKCEEGVNAVKMLKAECE
ncbi:MAG: DUF285 domain-containing protein [Proteobacteria bacterium]|nr:DUF285 domain-containing protein [Pseudomonadota bacterium]